jgi:ATP-dependent 26S proteasome regulatory subunit
MAMAGTADPKLIHLVGRLLQSKGGKGVEATHNNINALVQQLCHQHREYQRKNVTQLTRDVQSAVTHWQQREANQNSNSVKLKKRKHQPLSITTAKVDATVGNENESDDDDDENDDDEYDRAAIIHDTIVAAATSVSGNSLNDRLLQIQTVKKLSNMESNDKIKKSTNTPKKSSFRIDVIDSQDEISETFADEDNHMNQNRTISNDNVVYHISNDMEAHPKEAEIVTSKSSTNRKRKLVRRSSSRVDGGSKKTNLGVDGQAVASLSFTTPVERPTERYSDLGGMDHIITTIRQLVEYPITRPELYRHLGVDPPRGVLLRGPPGT